MLRGANFEGVDLRRATLNGACFHQANLSGARLYRSTLKQADFSGANLSNAEILDDTGAAFIPVTA